MRDFDRYHTIRRLEDELSNTERSRQSYYKDSEKERMQKKRLQEKLAEEAKLGKQLQEEVKNKKNQNVALELHLTIMDRMNNEHFLGNLIETIAWGIHQAESKDEREKAAQDIIKFGSLYKTLCRVHKMTLIRLFIEQRLL